ncbi:MAG: hypothetical protein AAFR81_17000 [Chloroflexota bacterium]
MNDDATITWIPYYLPIEIRWYIPEKVILIEMIDTVTVKEFNQIFEERVEGTFHVIVYTDRIAEAPPMRVLTEKREASKTEWVIFVSENVNPLGRFLVSTAVAILRQKFRFVPSFEAANRELQRIDETLSTSDLPPYYDHHPLEARYESSAEVRS